MSIRLSLASLAMAVLASLPAQASVLCLGADATNPINGPNRLDIMQSRVLNGATIGGFSLGNVDTYDGKVGTPSLATLKQYDSVIVWTDMAFADPTTLGNNLADYVDAGHGVIVMSFGSAFGIGGRWAAQGYDPLLGGYNQDVIGTIGTIYAPTSPIFAGVSSIQGEYIQPGTARPGATVLATWNISSMPNSSVPMVVQSNGLAGKVVDLNFYGAYPYPNTHGDIDRLIANTAAFVGYVAPEPSTIGLALSAIGVSLAYASRRRKPSASI